MATRLGVLAVAGMTAALWLAAASPAEAISFTHYTTYAGPGGWQQAVETYWVVQTEDFNGPPATTTPGTFQDGTWNSEGLNNGLPNANGVNNNQFEDVVDTSEPGPTSYQTVWNFDDPIRAWGATFDLNPYGEGVGPGLDILISYSGGTPLVRVLNASGFYGFISDTDFDQVIIRGDGLSGTESLPSGDPLVGTLAGRETYTMDNMVYAPEPATLTLLGLGLGAAALLMRRRRDD